MRWARADFASFRLTVKALLTPLHAFQANGCSIGDGKRENMHRPGHFAADFLKSDRLLGAQIDIAREHPVDA